MRIRKNKKLSPLMFPQGSRPDGVHVCRLNQSTWDVVPLSPEPFLHHRFEYEDSFNGNGSTGDSIGAVESVATMVGSKEGEIMKVRGMVIDDNDDNNEIKTPEQLGFESQSEEEEVKESNQEPALLKSCNNNTSSGDSGNNLNPGKKDENYINQPTVSRRGRARTSRRGSSSASNPYEFYYYSGFGPSWGKKRRGGNKEKGINRNLHVEPEEVENNGSVITAQNNSALSSSSQIDDNEEFDYEEDEEEGDENGDSGKKRMRKPIKARSLKSLM